MQRVRLALPYLRDCGWEPTVLALEPNSVEGAVYDPQLIATYPADIRIVRVRGLSPRLTRWAGIGNLWWRCGRALTRAGEKLLRAEKFDLVVSDLGLPDGDGRDLMKELHDRDGLSGIAISGYGMEEDIEKSRAAGFAEHLTKPIQMQELQ